MPQDPSSDTSSDTSHTSRPSRRPLRSSRLIQLGVGGVISLVALFLAVRTLDGQEVWQTLLATNPLLLTLALASVAVNTLSKAVRWRVLLGKRGISLSFTTIAATLVAGQALNTLFPARVGDLGRAHVVGRRGKMGRVYVLGTIVLEKILDLLSYTVLFLVVISLMPLPSQFTQSALPLIIGTAIIFGVILLLLSQQQRVLRIAEWGIAYLPQRMQATMRWRVESILESFQRIHDRSDRWWLLFWSVVIWATAIATNYLTFHALNLSPTTPWLAATVLLVVLQAGISIPSVPGTIGVFEYVCVVTLMLFGVEHAPAFSYGVLLHAVVMLPTTVIGGVLAWVLGLSGSKVEQLAQEQQDTPPLPKP